MGKCCSSRLENEQYSEVGDDGRKREDNDALIENTNKSLVSGKERMEGDKYKVCNRGYWRPAEDSKLKEPGALHGPQNWNLIAEKLKGRSSKSCRLRWFHRVNPKINRIAFNEEEEERLMAAHKVYAGRTSRHGQL
ncbi:PREDICTED: transcription factor MYB44-like [Populus euphratica]|uniref:Transcription factor MYB44-like n=1 Tax=Populus euphratica TaxID=75702 RepID=A0AAJ6T0R4_POPEU|nr:PREDICTED: transcription factor MYB44-like [Populus euphratica]